MDAVPRSLAESTRPSVAEMPTPLQPDFHTLVKILVDHLAHTFEVLTVTARLWDETEGGLRIVASASKVDVPAVQHPHEGISFRAFQEDSTVVLNDYAHDLGAWPVMVERGTRAAAAIPIRVQNRPVGAVVIGAATANYFTPERLATFQMLANHVGALLERVESEERERAQAAALKVLFEVSRILGSQQPLSTKLAAVVDVVLEFSGAAAAALRSFDEDAKSLRLEAVAGDPSVTSILRISIPVSGNAAAAIAFRTGREVTLNHYATSQGVEAKLVAAGIGSSIALPVAYENHTIGVLMISSKEDRHFPQQLVQPLAMIGRNLGVLLEHARLQEAQRRHAVADRTLATIADVLAGGATFDARLASVLTMLAAHCDADYVTLRVPTVDSQGLRLWAVAPTPPPSRLLQSIIPVDGTLGGDSLRLMRPVVSNRISVELPDDSFARRYAATAQTEAIACLPVIANGQPIGVISAASSKPDRFTPDRVLFLTQVASGIGTLIENARLSDQLRQHATDLENRVAQRTVELKAANDELEAFAYSVAHDLRAPLRALDGFSLALIEDYRDRLDEQGKHYLANIRHGAQWMGSLINELLALSRVSRADLVRQEVDLSRSAQEIADILLQREPGRQVSFVIQSGLIADGDQALLKTLLQNLLDNAWKFTSRHATATIEFGARTVGGEQVYYVRDDGAGFDPNHSEMLFKPFARLHSQVEFEGNGVGLATVARIVSRHGGRVWAQGIPEGGATISFTLR